MKVSNDADVREMYDGTAESYASIMDGEIELPVYDEGLARLASEIADLPGPVVDVSCGSGHMLQRYHERHDEQRDLIGTDLSPAMVALASERLGTAAQIEVGDMRDVRLSTKAAAIINFYALHHLDPDSAAAVFESWFGALAPGGRLWLATWEGEGPIDYGDHAELVALRYTVEQVRAWAEGARFVVDCCERVPIEGFDMHAVYLHATRP